MEQQQMCWAQIGVLIAVDNMAHKVRLWSKTRASAVTFTELQIKNTISDVTFPFVVLTIIFDYILQMNGQLRKVHV